MVLPADFGSEWAVGDVFGVAVDMRRQGAALKSVFVNGSFDAPNGAAFSSIDAPQLLHAFSAMSGQYLVNFGDRPFARAPVEAQCISVPAAAAKVVALPQRRSYFILLTPLSASVKRIASAPESPNPSLPSCAFAAPTSPALPLLPTWQRCPSLY